MTWTPEHCDRFRALREAGRVSVERSGPWALIRIHGERGRLVAEFFGSDERIAADPEGVLGYLEGAVRAGAEARA